MNEPQPDQPGSAGAETGETRFAVDPESVKRLRHDLRTPLNQIIGYSEMLIETVADGGPPSLMAELQRLHASGGKILAILNESLAQWRIDSGKVDLDVLRTSLVEPIKDLMAMREACDISAGQHALSEVSADLAKIGMAASNLHKLLDAEAFRQRYHRSENTPPVVATGAPVFGIGSRNPVTEGGAPPEVCGRILVVDDEPLNREMLMRRLDRLGHQVTGVENGLLAIEALNREPFDLVLLDILMPVLDGYQTLERIKMDPKLRHIPIVMLTALDEVSSTVRCIEAGAEDYVPKPFNPIILQARISASMEKKRLRDKEQAFLAELQVERAKSERLLLNILPKAICERLKAGEETIVDAIEDATVLFADIVGFTRIASTLTPDQTVALLNEIFSDFDQLAEKVGVEKIKTIGDAYMVVAGVPLPAKNHAMLCAEMALQMLDVIDQFNRRNQLHWTVRIGLHTGPVVAGIIGSKKFAYDLWGDTVNIASRLESHGEPGTPQVSAATAEKIASRFILEQRGLIELKNRGELMAYRLLGRA